MKFSRVGIQKDHEKTHTGEKQYACSFCDKKFGLDKAKEVAAATPAQPRRPSTTAGDKVGGQRGRPHRVGRKREQCPTEDAAGSRRGRHGTRRHRR